MEVNSFFNSDYANLLEPISCTIRYVPIKRPPLLKYVVTCSHSYCSNAFSDVDMYCQSLAGLAKISDLCLCVLTMPVIYFSLLLGVGERGRSVLKR